MKKLNKKYNKTMWLLAILSVLFIFQFSASAFAANTIKPPVLFNDTAKDDQSNIKDAENRVAVHIDAIIKTIVRSVHDVKFRNKPLTFMDALNDIYDFEYQEFKKNDNTSQFERNMLFIIAARVLFTEYAKANNIEENFLNYDVLSFRTVKFGWEFNYYLKYGTIADVSEHEGVLEMFNRLQNLVTQRVKYLGFNPKNFSLKDDPQTGVTPTSSVQYNEVLKSLVVNYVRDVFKEYHHITNNGSWTRDDAINLIVKHLNESINTTHRIKGAIIAIAIALLHRYDFELSDTRVAREKKYTITTADITTILHNYLKFCKKQKQNIKQEKGLEFNFVDGDSCYEYLIPLVRDEVYRQSGDILDLKSIK